MDYSQVVQVKVNSVMNLQDPLDVGKLRSNGFLRTWIHEVNQLLTYVAL
jgi:hypothetical protein